MDLKLTEQISKYVSSNIELKIEDFIQHDSPMYEMTTALVSILIGHDVNTLRRDIKLPSIHIYSQDGVDLLRINIPENGVFSMTGFLAEDFFTFLVAVRIHEVESYELVNLPPAIRQVRIENLCRYYMIKSNNVSRFINLWVSYKNQ